MRNRFIVCSVLPCMLIAGAGVSGSSQATRPSADGPESSGVFPIPSILGTIAGRVTSESTGGEIVGAAVTLTRGDVIVAEGTSGKDGQFVLVGIAPGTYTISANGHEERTVRLSRFDIYVELTAK